MTATIRAKLIAAACFVAVVGLMYAALAVYLSAFGLMPPGCLDVLLLGYVIWRALHGLDSVAPLVRAVRGYLRDRDDRHRDALHEAYGVGYRATSPPSHAA